MNSSEEERGHGRQGNGVGSSERYKEGWRDLGRSAVLSNWADVCVGAQGGRGLGSQLTLVMVLLRAKACGLNSRQKHLGLGHRAWH